MLSINYVVMPYLSVHEIEAGEFEVLPGLLRLAGVVESSQLGDKIGRVLGRVDRQRLGNHQQGTGELGDGQLFPAKTKPK